MDNNVRFRNHISIVVEKLGVLGGIVVAYLIANANTIADLVSLGMPSENLVSLFLAGVAILMVLLFVVGYNVAVWSRTWISLVDGSLVVERNTLQQRKNVIGIKNISNVNLEQNLFEMLIGTCKVKLDTNSLSTSDATDVKIVLKKADAEAFRAEVTALMRQAGAAHVSDDTVAEQWDYVAATADIIRHGVLSIRLTVVLAAVLSVTALLAVSALAFRRGAVVESIGGLVVNLLFFGGIALSSVMNLLGGFFKYYGFRAARRGEHLVLCYGLFKKVRYTIPVATINGFKLRQTPLARLTGHAMAEVINIGMGDDKTETESFLFPYSKTVVTLSQVKALLPELAPALDLSYERQSKGVWLVWLWSMLGMLLAAGLAVILGEWAITGWHLEGVTVNGVMIEAMGPWRAVLVMIMWGLVLLGLVAAVITRFLRFLTEGSRFGDDYILLVHGAYGRSYCWIAYHNIQFIRLQQGPTARWMQLTRGRVHILAAAGNQVQRMPYILQSDAEVLKEHILTS